MAIKSELPLKKIKKLVKIFQTIFYEKSKSNFYSNNSYLVVVNVFLPLRASEVPPSPGRVKESQKNKRDGK